MCIFFGESPSNYRDASAVPPSVPPPHGPENPPRETPPRATFLFCTFLFFTRPGRLFSLAPELLLFVGGLDGALFRPDAFLRLPAESTLTALASLCAHPAVPQDSADQHPPTRPGALLPASRYGLSTHCPPRAEGSARRGQGKSELTLTSRSDHWNQQGDGFTSPRNTKAEDASRSAASPRSAPRGWGTDASSSAASLRNVPRGWDWGRPNTFPANTCRG